MENKPKLLFAIRGPVPPSEVKEYNLYSYLSEKITGDLVSTSWPRTSEQLENINHAMGEFNFHPVTFKGSPFPISSILNLFRVYKVCFKLCKKNKYDAIVIYGPYLFGIGALVLRAIFGIPVIAQVPGHPIKGFLSRNSDKFFSVSGFKKHLSKHISKFVCRKADIVRLLYPSQLDGLNVNPSEVSVFHDFIPVNALVLQREKSLKANQDTAKKRYILSMGMPWYLKGIDLLIEAFHRVADDYPDLHLKVVGHEVQDRAYFEGLAKNHPRIELANAVKFSEAKDVIQNSEIFVLASRTEAMGRVLLESMAFEVPIVASEVDGVPFYLEKDKGGLLFECENIDELENSIRDVLDNPAAAKSRALIAKDRLLTQYNEEAYTEEFYKMAVSLRDKKAG